MAWYRGGSVSLVNGSAVVTGAGTNFVDNVSNGEAFLAPDGKVYEITQIVSATQLVLGQIYTGGSANAQGYAILPTQSFARDLALGAAQLLNTFAGVRDGIGAGLFPDGSEATPALRFAADQDTGIARAGANSISMIAGGVRRLTADTDGAFVSGSRMDIRGTGASKLTHSTNVANYSSGVPEGANRWCVSENQFGTEGLSVVGGNVGIGAIAPRAKLEIYRTNPAVASLILSSSFAPASYVELNAGVSGVSNGGFEFRLGGAPRFVVDDGGNMLIGVTSGNTHTIKKGATQGDAQLTIFGAAQFFVAGGSAQSSAAALLVSFNTTNGRSINAGGTVNASGADYAEYMTKAKGCGPIGKGDVCGVDADGLLTRSWSAAVSFVVKSTDPSLVGGDIWAADLGPRPELVEPEPVEPGEGPAAPGDDATEEAVAAYVAAADAYASAVAAFPSEHAAWEKLQAKYERDLTAWEKGLEAARQHVDRIAFCGQVPCNVSGDFAVGDYIVADSNGSGIKGVAVSDASITFEQYRKRIGKVWAVRDGRAWIDVQHG